MGGLSCPRIRYNHSRPECRNQAVTPRLLLSESLARARRSRLAHGLFILNFLPAHATSASLLLSIKPKKMLLHRLFPTTHTVRVPTWLRGPKSGSAVVALHEYDGAFFGRLLVRLMRILTRGRRLQVLIMARIGRSERRPLPRRSGGGWAPEFGALPGKQKQK